MARRFLVAALCAATVSCSHTPTQNNEQPLTETTEVTREPESTSRWVLSGYLPEAPTQEVFITIKGNVIESISTAAPKTSADIPLIKTDGLIFPGLIDLHSHLENNILPLWSQARGQFNHRFEWRKKSLAYKNAVQFNMGAFDEQSLCAAFRWSELKALAGGTTTIQGIGRGFDCLGGVGIRNIEVGGDLGSPQRMVNFIDVVIPHLVGKVFEPHIRRHMTAETPEAYDPAFEKMLESHGFTTWINDFKTQNVSLETGLKLLFGPDFPAEKFKGLPPENIHLNTELKSILIQQKKATEKSFDKTRLSIKKWLLGDSDLRLKGYLELSTSDRNSLKETDLLAYASHNAVIQLNSDIRTYIQAFELKVRRPALETLINKKNLGVITHLSEGKPGDKYNREEFHYAYMFGLIRPGVTLIHATGLDREDMETAIKNQVSLVWSPFSNLLLYGETMDIKSASEMKLAHDLSLNLTLGTDWSPTGSKNLLDELKIARSYLKKHRITSIDNEYLVKMVTSNAAKAINRDKVLGRIAENYFADILVIKPTKSAQTRKDAYDALVSATQDQVQLVSVGGRRIFGHPDFVEDTKEIIPQSCSFKKALSWGQTNRFDHENAEAKLTTYATIESRIQSKLKAHADKTRAEGKPYLIKALASLSPVFNCEDSLYTKRVTEFFRKELGENSTQSVRKKMRDETLIKDIGDFFDPRIEEPDAQE